MEARESRGRAIFRRRVGADRAACIQPTSPLRGLSSWTFVATARLSTVSPQPCSLAASRELDFEACWPHVLGQLHESHRGNPPGPPRCFFPDGTPTAQTLARAGPAPVVDLFAASGRTAPPQPRQFDSGIRSVTPSSSTDSSGLLRAGTTPGQTGSQITKRQNVAPKAPSGEAIVRSSSDQQLSRFRGSQTRCCTSSANP
ncbi:hypothetical protein BDY21DRAFT_45644 [Lineolata rhizophorae]|uniref:Uncharacterized protein n=1 Tax=Lineolata rhizophorae TaxID=578093 RepID=A0A6A6NYR9_9PEZI|nr:hypothetical protein BDY21DRAFT_45644 [Lineolata rhizophorae]